MSNSIIQVKKVTKQFKNLTALNNISLEIEGGKIHALLGPNGAGKTTLIRILATLSAPTSGELTIDGINVVEDPSKVRSIIGLAGQFAAVDDFMTGRETLEMVGSLYHMPKGEIKKRAAELLEQLSLTDAADRPAKTYSGGMRRRLDLGASLMFRPKIIFLDEPTTGLDPRTRLELWDVIRNLARDGSTVLLTTQYLDEADALASKITVIDKGGVVAEGTAAELKDSLGADVVEVHFTAKTLEKGREILTKYNKNVTEDDLTGAFRLPAKQGSKTLLEVARALQDGGVEPEELSLHRPTLDDVFLAVTGQKTEKK